MALDEWMAHIGVGAATLTITLEKNRFSRGETLTGTIVLKGGTVEQPVAHVWVKLQEHEQAGPSRYLETVSQTTVAEAIHIAPHQVLEYAFQLVVPAMAHLTTSEKIHRSQIAAEADIAWAINPSAVIPTQIVPESEIFVLDAAMVTLGFQATHKFFSEPIDHFPGPAQMNYRAPASLQDRITDATLEAHVEEGKVLGRLILNHRETYLKDYLKALIGGDKEKLPLEIPSERLRGEQAVTTAATLLQQMLDQALPAIDNGKTK